MARECDAVELMTVRVIRKWAIAEDIVGLELAASDGASPLPMARPGDHIDLHLVPGLVRSYSLCNGPGSPSPYQIAVKRLRDGRGGSVHVHDCLEVGQQLQISGPCNAFGLAAQAESHLLLAGGIGITPLLSMVRHLVHWRASVQLHQFAASPGTLAFKDELDAEMPAGVVSRHLGLSPADTARQVANLVEREAGSPGVHVYTCGPRPFMALVREAVYRLPNGAERFHLEHFQPARDQGAAGAGRLADSFWVQLARRGKGFQVLPGQSLLDALRDHGVEADSNCEQGQCGACQLPVLEGWPDHRDSYLSQEQKASGRYILPCVSRCKGDRLVLDI